MTDPRPTRRDLMKPVQLLGFAFAAAAFGGIIALVSMGFFQDLDAGERLHVIVVSLIVAGIAFIATLVIIALLMLAVDPAQVARPVDQGVLLPESEDDGSRPDGRGDDGSDASASPRPSGH